MPEEVKTPAAPVRREHFFALILLGALYALLSMPPLQPPPAPGLGKTPPGLVRVVLPPLPKHPEAISPYGPGLDTELLRMLARSCGYRLVFSHAVSPHRAWEMLAQGEADLFIGSGYGPPLALRGRFAAGPAYAAGTPVLIRGENVRRLYIRGAVGKRWERLASNPFLMKANPALEQQLLCEAPWLGRSMITRVDPRCSTDLLLDSLEGGQASYALMDSWRLRLWRPFFPDLRREKTFSQPISYRWYWRTQRRALAVTLNYFWQAAGVKAGLAELQERYFGFFPRKMSRVSVRHLLDTVTDELPKYRAQILHETLLRGIDPLLYVAMIYQESQFDPKAESKTGAKGLLQFTSAAAEFFHLKDPLDSTQSIRAGAEYLRMLWEELDALGLSFWDRWFFALVAYNQGKGHLMDAVELSRRLGFSGKNWAELKRVLPKLEEPEYARHARYGVCRGREAVQFVDNIRYYYYILRGLVSLARPEAKDLGPLVGRDALAAGSGL